MENLKKLEQIHNALIFLQSRGIISSQITNPNPNRPHSDRFLAGLFLYIAEPCGELGIEDKCHLILESLPKLSVVLLQEEAWLDGRNDSLGGSLSGEEKNSGDVSIGGLNNMGMIGFDVMQRANSTLEDFCRSYFLFHGMDVSSAATIFRYLPVLCFTESYIYQLDTLNEHLLPAYHGQTFSDQSCYLGENAISPSGSSDLFDADAFHPLILMLDHHGLLTDRITEELKHGVEYWALERKLCVALSHKIEISIEDAIRAIELKSFDYRVLNLLLYGLRKEEVNELHMEFLSVSEFLVEIADDMFDYEEDVLENNFNILRMFVGIYGTSAAPTMLAKFISEAEEKYDRLSKALDPELSSRYHKRCEEATKEGGKTSGPSLGSWTMPPLIANEESYRSMFQDSSQWKGCMHFGILNSGITLYSNKLCSESRDAYRSSFSINKQRVVTRTKRHRPNSRII
ncbi:hypothetical protein Droror1_Dr00015230 [Drosera rotundifolia]